MRTIVTGAAGFIGSHVAELLANEGHDVLAIDNLSGGFLENVPRGARFAQLDITSDLSGVFEGFRPEAVYHLAAYAAEGLSHHIPVFNYQNNLVGTARVLEAAYRSGAEHFVFTSSIAAYGHPVHDRLLSEEDVCHPCDPYGVAKLACEHHIGAFFEYFGRPKFTIFRPHNVFGPRQNISDPYRNVIGIFLSRALAGRPLPIFGDGLQSRSFSFITTVARCIADAPVSPKAANRTVNVGGDVPMSVVELARKILQLLGAPEQIEWLPARHEVMHAHCRHDVARELFPRAYTDAIGIEDGLKRMVKFVRGRPAPPLTGCPASIEISDGLPPSWKVVVEDGARVSVGQGTTSFRSSR